MPTITFAMRPPGSVTGKREHSVIDGKPGLCLEPIRKPQSRESEPINIYDEPN